MFTELKSRKINKTKFLDTLKENLIKKWTNKTGDISISIMEKGFKPFFLSQYFYPCVVTFSLRHYFSCRFLFSLLSALNYFSFADIAKHIRMYV
ncbi:hypothetical protein [Parapedobacter soli]|uniref:hypothetical protein n=1 Tax=Parapedobacter soli TaxID=416955 RepID=UPI0036F2DEC8